MEDHFAELRRLRDLRARSEQTMRWIDELIDREETAIANITANEKRAWMRRVNRGAVWTGAVGAAGAIREAVRESPGITAAVGGVTVALGAGAAAFAIGISGSEPPPTVAQPRPSVSIPAPRPSTPPMSIPEVRREPQRPPEVVTVPVRAELPAQPGQDGRRPKAPPAVPERSPAPSEETPPPAAAAEAPEAPACLADVQILAVVSAQLLCGQS